MRKEYKSGDIQYKFSEDISEDLIEVSLFNPNLFDNYDQNIVIEKDGSLTKLDLINQLDDMDYLEGVDLEKLLEDMRNDFREHIQLNELQDSITIEIRDFEYDMSEKVIPHTNFNIIFDDNTYNINKFIHQSVDSDFKFHISENKLDDVLGPNSIFYKLADDMESKYGEDITRDTLQKVLNEVDKCVASDTDLILEEQQEKQEKKQKKSKGFGMSM